MRIPDHDVAPGPLTRCQISGSSDLELIIDLGCQPLCDSLLTREQLAQPETYYPLRFFLCPESGLAQLDYVVDGAVVYHPDYPYRSGITKELAVYQRAFAEGIVRELAVPRGSLCVDIGSNDGTLLTGFKLQGMRALGVEPSVDVDIREHPVMKGDHYVLCSDGLSDMVEDEDIHLTISTFSDNLETIARQLVQLSNEHGGRDNISVIMTQVIDSFPARRGILDRILGWFG